MWKLFPDTWIQGANRFGHRHAAGAEALERNWLTWLAEGLRRTSPQVLDTHGGDPVRALRTLSGRALLGVDEALRAYLRQSTDDAPSSSRAQNDDEGVMDAYLFVAACNPSGFVREQALIAFARYRCPFALAAGLIRSTDWVAQVRSAASSLVRNLTPHLSSPELTRYLDLVVRLKDRVRVDEQLWQECIEQRLTSPESREALRAAAHDLNNSALLRRCAFEYLILGDPAGIAQVLESALADPDLRVGLWALVQIRGLSTAQDRLRLLTIALAAKHTVVRRTALRQYVLLNTQDGQQRLRAALLDPARGVRALAAFEFARRQGESALSVWREAAKSPHRAEAEVAVLALCESGEQTDVDGLLNDGVPRRAALRVALLRGLWRVESGQLESHLASALEDRSALVIRQAAQIYRRGTIALNVLTLERALARIEDRPARHLIALSEALGKWDGLEFLLRLATSENIERAACAADQIDRWILTANRRFTVPTSGQVQRLTRLFQNALERHPGREWRLGDLGLASFV